MGRKKFWALVCLAPLLFVLLLVLLAVLVPISPVVGICYCFERVLSHRRVMRSRRWKLELIYKKRGYVFDNK